MDKIINLGIPHVAELVFESIDTPGLFQCALVSETWKVLAENVLLKRWKGRFFEACKNGETKVVKLLLENKNVDFHTETIARWSEFMWACHNGHTDVVKLLLEHSNGHIKLNAKNGHGWTPFNRACQNGHTDVVKFLLEHFDRNVDLNTRHTNGFNAFMFACSNGHTDVVQLLLDHSKDRNIVVEIPNPRDFGGWTLHQDVGQMLMYHFRHLPKPQFLVSLYRKNIRRGL